MLIHKDCGGEVTRIVSNHHDEFEAQCTLCGNKLYDDSQIEIIDLSEIGE